MEMNFTQEMVNNRLASNASCDECGEEVKQGYGHRPIFTHGENGNLLAFCSDICTHQYQTTSEAAEQKKDEVFSYPWESNDRVIRISPEYSDEQVAVATSEEIAAHIVELHNESLNS